MDSSAREKLGEKIRKFRNRLGYSQEYMAQAMGKNDHTAYQRLETGRTEIKLDDFIKLARIFNVALHDLLDFDQDITPSSNNGNSVISQIPFTIQLNGNEENLNAQFELAKKLNEVLRVNR